jgi:hypothetical protein
MLESIIELSREYNDLFPMNFIEMKGIAGELEKMKIPLKPKEIPIKH